MRNAARADAKRRAGSTIPVRESSGNVFEDLGVPESNEGLVKAEIAARITGTIESRGLTQVKAAELLHVTQADVSDLVRGKLKGFSTERLFRFLNALGQDVEIVILKRRSSKHAGRLRVRIRDNYRDAARSKLRQ